MLVQVNRSSPAIWSIDGTPLLKFIRDYGRILSFKWFLPGDTIKIVGVFFVDDSIIIQVAPFPGSSDRETFNLTQQGLNIFAGAAQSTGGQVSEENKKLYLLEFVWYEY